MKKYFVMAFAFVAAIAMTSCKGGNDPAKDGAKISFTQKAYELGVGDTQRLSTTITPAGTELQLKFASSDATVATVSVSGIVTAVAEGTANIIVSAEGAVGDTCVITVSDMAVYNQFDIADYGLFGLDPIPNTDTILILGGGEYKVQLAMGDLIAWDGNVLYVDGSGFAGAGLVINAQVPFYLITEGQYAGQYIGSANGFRLYPNAPIQFAHGEAGTCNVDAYGQFLESYIAGETSEDIEWDLLDTAFPGAHIYYFDYTDPDNPFQSQLYGRYYGQVDKLDFDDEEDILWSADLTWYVFTDDDRYFGLKINKDEEGYIESVVKPYDMKTYSVHLANYDESEEEEVEGYKFINMKKVHKELPSGFRTNVIDRRYKK